MEELNLDYIEQAIAYSSVFGRDREIFCPSVVDYVSKDTIKDDKNRLALEILKDFYGKNKQIPSVAEMKVYLTTEDKVETFKAFLKGYKNFDSKDFDTAVLLRNTEEFFKQRIIANVMDEAFITSSTGGNLDIGEVYGKIEDAMSIHMLEDIGLNLFKDREDYIEELLNDTNRISTGFSWLDQQLGGGLLTSGSALYNFCAASNVGKSNFIKSLACNMSKDGKNVLVISLEMPRYIYANRFVAEMADVSISNLKDEVGKIGKFLKAAPNKGYGDILIKDFATGSLTPQGLSSFIKRAERHLGINFDCVFVDYPELLRSPRHFARHDLMVANLYVETRALSFYHKKPFVVVSQLNRDAYNKEKPSMENIGNGIGIMQCSDFGGFLYATDEMKELNQIGQVVAKSRFGPVNKSKRYNVCPQTLKITESNLMEEHIVLEEEDEEDEDAEDFFAELMGDNSSM